MVKRQSGHYIKDNRGTTRPQAHLFFDIESELIQISPTETEHVFKMGWTCHWRRRGGANPDTIKYEYMDTPGDLVRIINSHVCPKSPLLVIAHNVAYDAGVMGLFALLNADGWTMTSFYAANMSVIIVFTKAGKKIKIMDNGNYFKTALAKLGDTLDLPKLTIDFDSSGIEELSIYCKRDVEIMLVAWQRYYDFLDLHDFGMWGIRSPRRPGTLGDIVSWITKS